LFVIFEKDCGRVTLEEAGGGVPWPKAFDLIENPEGASRVWKLIDLSYDPR
jgi:hypothetical protein